MDPREIVDAYLQGRIESWGVFRRLVRLGLSTATALAVAAALPTAVNANSAGVIGGVAHSAQESPLLDLLMSHLASQLEKAAAGGPVRPLASTLARIGGNNTNLIKCGGGNENLLDANDQLCESIDVKYNDGVNNLNGALTADLKGNVVLQLNGSIGQSNVNLFGIFDSPRDAANGRNIGKVNMNVAGNVGDVNVNLNGNLASLDKNNNNNNR